MRNGYLAAALVIATWLDGCSTAPVSMADTYDPPMQVRANPQSAGACGIYLEKVEDLRLHPQDLGYVAGRPVQAGDMLNWLSSSLDTLQTPGFRIDTANADNDQLVLDVQLLKAYMRSAYTSVDSTIAVRVIYKRPDQSVLGQGIYRGSDTSMNWASGDNEIRRDFQLATADMLKQLSPDLDRYCDGTYESPAVSGTGNLPKAFF